MKILIFAGLLIGSGWFYVSHIQKDRELAVAQNLIHLKEQVHVANPPVDDSFSNRAFKKYLEFIDYQKRYLTKADYLQLEAYRYILDDEVKEGHLDFFDLSNQLLDKAVDKVEGFYKTLIQGDLQLDKMEVLDFEGKHLDWARDDEMLKDRWRKILKYEVLTDVIDAMAKQEKDTVNPDKPLDSLKIEAIEDTRKNFERYFDRLHKLRRADRFGDFMNSMTMVMDPHSNYFSPKEKEDFDINMSGRLEGIGARLSQDKDYIKVVAIIPGGPAWKQKQLEVNDLIMKVTQEEGEPMDVKGMRIDDVVKKIRGKKGTKVMLTVKKESGIIQDIEIVRDEVILDEGLAKSLMIEDKNGTKVGYLLLPKFYTNFNSPNGPKCANDVNKEIHKLQADGAQAIILDLRNNGGGSLREVVDMAGLFVEKGPIVQVKAREARPFIYKDRNSSVSYAGPLVVMVNSYSASASEILAAALQDYDRAIIVGGTSTFGKGTVQRFFDLDRMVYNNKIKPLGQVKMTTQKYYRISGQSVQLKGVIPDVQLPDRFTYVKTGEKEYDYPLPWDVIQPVRYRQNVFNVGNIKAEVEARSRARTDTMSIFQKIDEYAKWYKKTRDETVYPLQIDSLRVKIENRKKKSKEFRDLLHNFTDLSFSNLNVDTAYIQVDSSRIARNEDWLKRVKKDVYLYETVHIAEDLIALKK